MVEKKTSRRSRRAKRRDRSGEVVRGAEEARDDSEDDDSEDDDSEDDDSEDDQEPAERPNRAQRRVERSRRRRSVRETEEAREAIRDRNRDTRQRSAQKRRDKRRKAKKQAEVAVGLDASEMVDDVLARVSFKTTRWVRENSFLVQAVAFVAFVSLCGWTVYRYFSARARDARSDVLFTAVDRQTGHVGEPVEPLMGEEGNIDPRPTYATREEQLVDAEAAYREVLKGASKTQATTVLAELGLATVLLQQGKYDEALSAYDSVKVSALAKRDPQVLGRALEGVGLCLEGKGDQKAALAAYQELQNTDIPRFSKLGLYHRTRIAHEQGDTTLAKELLAELEKKVGTPDDPMNPGYTAAAMMELQMAIDPSTGNNPLQALKKLEQLQKSAKDAAETLKKTGLGQLPIDLDLKPSGAPSSQAPAPEPAPAPAPAGSR